MRDIHFDCVFTLPAYAMPLVYVPTSFQHRTLIASAKFLLPVRLAVPAGTQPFFLLMAVVARFSHSRRIHFPREVRPEFLF